MTAETRHELFSKLFDEILTVTRAKGQAYSGAQDSLANFKRGAEALGLTKYQVWSVYFSKHHDSLMNAIKANPERPVEKTESLHGRIVDAIAYLAILKALAEEDGI